MADNDDYMVSKTTDDEIVEVMWDRLQEGINANRRFRLKGVAGGNNMRYSSTKVVWDTDIYIYFTRESDGTWVYNKINSNPTTGITCNDDDLLYVTLSDTTATVLTISSVDYTSMPTDDTGRILVLGAVRSSRWYGISSTDISHDSILSVSIDDHHARDHNNTEHTTNYEAANANIQAHVGSPPTDSHHTRYTDSEVEGIITAEIVDGQSIDLAIDSLISTHTAITTAHHTKYALTDDLSSQEITQLQTIGEVTTISAGQWGYLGALTESPQTHMSAANPHSGSEPTITYGIANTNVMKAENTPADNDFAKFTLTGLEGRSYSETLSDIGAAASGHGHGQLHDRSHVFTSVSDHTASGLTVGQVIRASAATTFAWSKLAHSDLSDAPTDAHHVKTTLFTDLTDDIVYTQLDSVVDTTGGGAVDLISRADHVHTAADGSSKVTYTDLLSIPSTFTPSNHDIITTHTDSGLTIGNVIRASGASSFAWAQLSHSDLNDDESTQHFLQSAITTVGTLSAGNVSARDSVGLIASKASGDMFYWTTALQRLAKATDGDVMTLASGLPSWQTPGAPGAHASSHEIGGGDLVDHDNLTNFVANEHIDWTNDTAGNSISVDSTVVSGATFYRSDQGAGSGPWLNLGKSAADVGYLQTVHDASGYLTDFNIVTVSGGGVSAANFGDIVFKPDNVIQMRLSGKGNLTIGESDAPVIEIRDNKTGDATYWSTTVADEYFAKFIAWSSDPNDDIGFIGFQNANVGSTTPFCNFVVHTGGSSSITERFKIDYNGNITMQSGKTLTLGTGDLAGDHLVANESTYVQIVSASLVATGGPTAITGWRTGTWHRTTATGNPTMFFEIQAPEFLSKYAEDNSKTLKVTDVDIWWADNNASDYLDRVRIWKKDYDANTGSLIKDDGTNWGSGSTTIAQKLTYDVTDTIMVRGDWIFIYIDLVQASAESQRIFSFELTYTLT